MFFSSPCLSRAGVPAGIPAGIWPITSHMQTHLAPSPTVQDTHGTVAVRAAGPLDPPRREASAESLPALWDPIG